MKIELYDNSTESSAKVFNRKDVEDLFVFSGKPVSKLCEENKNILVFPNSINDTVDKIGNSCIYTINNTEDPSKVKIVTGNIMGFLGVKDLKLKIKSRFDKDRDDYFLHYMLQKVFSFNLFDMKHNSEQDDVFDFMMFMFPMLLNNALRQGIYREYQTISHNDANIKGCINVSKHISKNIPFIGSIAYTSRKYSHDNNMTELIRHTIEFINTKKYGSIVLNLDRDTIDNVNSIIEQTPAYNKNDRRNIISKNLRKKTHPFYTAYTPLQRLCIQILRMDDVKYGNSEDEISGILFDGAWLWEEYLNTILRNHDFIHPENKLKTKGIYLFENETEEGRKKFSGVRYPDFYNKEKGIVLDAKYKRLGDYDKVSKVDRDDIHQIITYMDNLKADRGGFVVPLINEQTTIPMSRLKDTLRTMAIFGIEVGKCSSSFNEFCHQMKYFEQKFVKDIISNYTL